MKTVIGTFLAAAAVSVSLIAASLPASAGYTSPDTSKSQQAFTNGVP